MRWGRALWGRVGSEEVLRLWFSVVIFRGGGRRRRRRGFEVYAL